MTEEFREEIAGGAGAGDPAGRDRRAGGNTKNIAAHDKLWYIEFKNFRISSTKNIQ